MARGRPKRTAANTAIVRVQIREPAGREKEKSVSDPVVQKKDIKEVK